MKKTIIALGLLSFCSTAMANTPNWDQVEAAYLDSELKEEGFSQSMNGVGVSASKTITDTWFALGQYDSVSGSDSGVNFDVDTLSVGAGYRKSVSATADAYATVTVERLDLKLSIDGFGSGRGHENGFGIGAGIRNMLNESVELGAKVDYVVLDNDDVLRLNANAFYYVTPSLSLGLGYQMFSVRGEDFDINTVRASVRYAF